MELRLSERQHAARTAARAFAAGQLAPWADRIDREERTPATVVDAVRASGYLGAALPEAWGGGGLDAVSYGVITEEIGAVCSSVRSLLTVHNMAAQAIARFATAAQKTRWLPALCRGEQLIGFALTEPEAGSATAAIQTQAVEDGDAYVITGRKRWITYGQIADRFLVFGRLDGQPIALVVDRETPGLSISPMSGVFGTRGSMLAELAFDGARVARDCLLGAAGMGLGFVANTALDHGRFSVAWGSTGIVRACLDACVMYARERRQGEGLLRDYQLIRRQLADMLVAHTASRALCYRAACLRDTRDPCGVMETSLAKYHAASAAGRVANDAVHLHGGNGCSPDYPVSRYLRDATVMGIIEGSHEILQLALADYAFQRQYLE